MITTELEPASIPRDLDLMPPGPRLAAVLSTIEVDRLSGRAAILFARAQNRQISHDQARQYQALSRVGELYMESSTDVDLWEFASVEIGAALTQSRRTAAFEMGLADDIVNRYPTLFTSLLEGRFDLAQVRAIVRGVGHVDREVANRAIDLLLPEAAGLTSGQISARLRRLVIEADPEAARQAYEDGIAAAKVWSQVDPDGTATMIATGMEPHRLSAANRNINRLARARKNGGDPRPIDKIRADVFVELLTGEIATSSAQRGEVKVTGDLTTLTRLDDRPGFLEGYGPVIADIVRQIALQQQNSRWTFEIRDPQTGEVYVGTTSRRPTTMQRRQLEARYETCVHPGCRMPASQCDFDHTRDRARGGLTTLCNLAPLCRFHHRNRHLTAWTYRKLPDGTIEWHSHFGLQYVTHPP